MNTEAMDFPVLAAILITLGWPQTVPAKQLSVRVQNFGYNHNN